MTFLPKIFCASILVLCAITSASSAERFSKTELPSNKLHPFLKTYCINCHGPEEQNGQVRFDKASWTITNNDEAQRWQEVLDVLNGGDMPPEDAKQPSSAELSGTLDVLTGSLLQARKRLTDHGGESSMRRLNQREYAATIRELFGFELSADLIPDDGEPSTFDTVGDEQLFTSSHFEKYLNLGKDIAKQGFQWSGKPHRKPAISIKQPEDRVTSRLRIALADLDNKMRMKNEGKTWQEMGFKDEGEMKIIFSQFKSRAGKPRRYLQYPLVDQGVYLVDANNETKRTSVNHNTPDPRAIYKYRVRAGIVDNPPNIRTFLRVMDQVGTVGTLKVQGTTANPEVIEMEYRPLMGQRVISLQVEENKADIRFQESYLKRIDPKGNWASIWIDWAEIEGPFYENKASFFERLLYPDPTDRSIHNRSDANARKLITDFAYEAFRRKHPQAAYIDKLVELFNSNRKSGQTFDQSMSEVIGVVLASPQFLFIQEETGQTQESKKNLSAQELAIRLSYFLWSCPPDATLYQLAENETLLQPDILQQQVDRMLDDPRSSKFIEGFIRQWTDLKRFDAITVNEQDNYYFNKGIRHSATKEVYEFFSTLVKENLPASNLISSDFVVVNSLLAEHYGIANVHSNEFQKVMLPTASPRGGLLGQTAFLTLGSNGERSSPVIRGAYVMEKLLHDKPAPPPPNVPELGATSNKPTTNREMVELHQKQAVCASCHKKMDVIGFGLENFDTIGKWRETEKVGRAQVPIKPGGTLPNGTAFENIKGLKLALLSEEPQLAKELTESLLAYALGRTIEFSDADEVDNIIENITDDKFRVRSMIHAVTQSRLFLIK